LHVLVDAREELETVDGTVTADRQLPDCSPLEHCEYQIAREKSKNVVLRGRFRRQP
jgi:hypothetical protein